MMENWQRYICEYRHDGAEWSVEVVATSFEDASRRLRAIGTNGQVNGVIHLKLQARIASRALAICLGAGIGWIAYWTATQWGLI